jgi:hypothetical protein
MVEQLKDALKLRLAICIELFKLNPYLTTLNKQMMELLVSLEEPDLDCQ